MKQKPQRLVLAVLLALLVSLSACVPALAASGDTGESSGERATLGELIALDRAYLEGVYQAMRKAGKQSSVPAWNEHTELAALAAVLVSQQMLVERASQAEFRNLTESLRAGREPTPAAEQIKLTINALDLYFLHDVLINSIPTRWSEVSEPNDAVRRQLKKTAGSRCTETIPHPFPEIRICFKMQKAVCTTMSTHPPRFIFIRFLISLPMVIR